MKLPITPLTRLALCLFVLLTFSKAQAQTPVSINGQLKVINGKLCNQFNTPIQLRGMSTHGIQWYGWNDCLTETSLDTLAYGWGSDILRISMYVQEGGYESNKTFYRDQVIRLVREATDRGMYALIDFHQLTPGDPNANLANATEFFTDVCDTLKNYNNVIYDVANEPNGVTWAQIKTYADQIIPVIRNIDGDAVVLCGTHGWASFGESSGGSANDVINNPLTFSNIMYGFHFYANSHGNNYLSELQTAVNAGLPVFVTEFGSQNADGDGTNNLTMANTYLDYLAQQKISWCNWNFSDDFRSGAVWKTGTCSNGPWSDANLKEAGLWIKGRMLSPADDWGNTNVDCNGDANGSAYLDNCNRCVGGNAKKLGYSPNGIWDNVTLSEGDMGGLDGGIYYWDAPNGSNDYPNFKAVKTRDVNAKEQVYNITQQAGEYGPIGLSFGKNSEGGPLNGTTSTIDLSGNATMEITLHNKSSYQVVVQFAIQDSLGSQITHSSTASSVTNFQNEAWQHALNATLNAGEEKSVTINFTGGYYANYNLNQLEQNLDYKIVSGIGLTVTNAATDNNWVPLILNGADIAIKKIKVGAPDPATPCVVTSTSASATNRLTVYPNPVDNILYFQNTSILQAEITDINGKVLLKRQVLDGKMDLSSLKSGIYFARDLSTQKVVRIVKK